MKKTLIKEFWREIKGSINRFISILLIVLLGVGFFIGVKAASPSMKYSADKFFQKNHLMDFELISDFGFQDEDIEAVKKLEGVLQVQPAYTADLIVEGEASNNVVRVHSLPVEYRGNNDIINQVNLVEGRLPEKPGECLVDSNQQFENTYKIGDKVKVSSPYKDVDINTIVKEDTFTIVGLVESPLYISYDRGVSQVGDGSILYYMMILPEDFAYQRFTEVYVRTTSSAIASSFSEEYKNSINEYKEIFKQLGVERAEINKNNIINEGNKQLQEAKDKLAAEKAAANEKFKKAEEQINTAKADIAKKEAELNEAQKKLENAEADIEAAKNSIYQSEIGLAEAKRQYNKKIASAQKEIDDGNKAYYEGLDQYNKAYADFQVKKQQAEAEIAKGKAELESLKYFIGVLEEVRQQIISLPNDEIYNKLDEIMEQIKAANESAPPEHRLTPEQISQIEAEIEKIKDTMSKEDILNLLDKTINEQKQKYEDGLAKITAAEKELADAENEFAVQKQKLDDTRAKLDAAQETLNREKIEGQNQLNYAQWQIDNAKQQLVQAQQEYENGKLELEQGRKALETAKTDLAKSETELKKAKAEAEEKFKDAEETIKLKEAELNSIVLGKWYILTRYDNPGFKSFADDAERIDGIASIFPLFFFIVAALVCLTTMTRMVEEERIEIGTLKALGYSDISVISKYFYYALFAALIGSVLGAVAGLAFLPRIIFNAYKAMYKLPNFYVSFSWEIVIIALIGALLCTCSVAVFVAFRELKLVPAMLMRPKAPKNGKHILIEKISFIWRNLNFTSKVTVRNIFRYKVRFIMTVLGIAGCTALILSAYGLKDSISVVVPKQYGEIYSFDSIMSLKYEGNLSNKEILKTDLEKETRFSSNMFAQQTIMNGYINDADENKIEVRLFVPENNEVFEDYVKLLNPSDGNSIKFTDSSVVVTNKFAKLLGLNVGDTLKIFDDNINMELKITDITENYVYNYIYISPDLYKEKTGKDAVFNTIFSKFTEEGKNNQELIAEKWLKNYNVMSITFTSSVIENFNEIVASLNNIVMVMIICAAALAFIVLYNLTNINVAERTREIATIKVLGFSKSESANYVYRENIILSIIGILIGVILGIFLTYFIVSSVEMDIVMFGRVIKPISFIYASAFTFIFTLLVNFAMYKRINSISMVESLKSIE